MTTRILHITAGNRKDMMQRFIETNPHGKVNWSEGKVTTFGVIHIFRRIVYQDDCCRLAGINFNSIIVDGTPPGTCLIEWLSSRCREPIIRPARSPTLRLIPETKPA